MALTTPSADEALKLFRDVEETFPSGNLGDGKWYLLVISAMSAGGHSTFAASLYNYLTSQPQFATPESRKALVRRLREAMVKLVSVVGVPKPLEAIFSIAEVERDEDKDYSFSRLSEGWNSGPENLARGKAWLSKIYQQNLTTKRNNLAAHRDFCSDHTILDGVDTELVVLSGIMMQNLGRETGWHLRGTRRIGVSSEDVETIQQCIEKVAAFCGVTLNRVPRVKDIEHKVVIST